MVTTIPWDTPAPLPAARYSLGVAADASGRIYAIAGYDGSGALQSTVYRYDPSSNSWSTLPSLAVALYGLAAATDLSGRIYALGGSAGNVQSAAYRYDPSANTWSTLTAMPAPRVGLGAAADLSGRIYAVGGSDGSGALQSTVYRYDPSSNSWSTLPALPSTLNTPGVASDSSGRIYVVGGYDTNGAVQSAAYRYDPSANTWSTLTAMPTARGDVAACTDASGRIYILGGFATAATGAVERFDPSSGSWTSLAAMPTARYRLGAARDSSGRIYAVGGVNGGTRYATVERASINSAPNAPTLTSPANNSTIDRGITQRFAWTFSDPDAGDSQSKFDLQYRAVGGSTWTTVTGTTPNTFYDFAAGTFAAGNYEWQVRTYDSQGVVGPWSTSSFFTAADAPAMPTITAPTSGSTVSSTATLTWSAPNQTDYQWRRVKDNAGAADTSTVYADSGDVVDSTTRSVTVTFDTNNRWEHLQVRVKYNGLWSAWSDIRVQVSYTPPAAPTFTLTPDNTAGSPTQGSILVAITNPTPGSGQPSVSYNDVYVSDPGKSEERRATNVAANGTWRYWTPPSGFDGTTAGRVRVVAVATNQTTASS